MGGIEVRKLKQWENAKTAPKFEVKRIIRILYIFKLEPHLVKLSNAKICTHSRNFLLIFGFTHWWGIRHVSFRGFHSLQLCENGA